MTSLTVIQAALKASDSEHAASLCALIENNQVGAYRSGVRQKFGPNETDRPQLGNKFALFSSNKIPAFQVLKETFLRAFAETPEHFSDRETYFAPATAADATAADATSDLSDENKLSQVSDNIRDLNGALETANHVISFLSDDLDDMRNEKSLEPENHLHTSKTRCTIMPSDTFMSLQHSNEGTTTTTLLFGSVLWVIWPPTDHNLQTLQAAYEDFAQSFEWVRLDVTQNLQDGLMFLQNKGEGLRIPPFCPMVSFATKTSVLATSSAVTIDNFISMLQKAPLLKAHFKIELSPELKQTDFNASILKWLDRLLNGKVDEETKALDTSYKLTLTEDGPLHELLNTWDDIKDGLAAMMSTTEHETMKNIWSVFLAGSKGRECKLCRKRVPKKHSLMREHFKEIHWPKENAAERVDSMEVVSQDGHNGEDAMEGVRTTGSTDDN